MQRIRMKKLGRSGRFWWAGPAQGFLRPGLYVLTGPGRQIRLLPVRTRPQHL